jgi:hypothetical protein
VEHDDVRAPVLRSGELVDAMAYLMFTSPSVSVPGRLRTYSEAFAKRLAAMVREFQATPTGPDLRGGQRGRAGFDAGPTASRRHRPPAQLSRGSGLNYS